MAQLPPPSHRKEFEIAIICALRKERDAVEALLDEEYEINGLSYGKAIGDHNAYTTGRIGNHYVVLVYMPGMGKASSAAVASTIRTSFEGIKVGIVVGICGGAPRTADGTEILLGDVIIGETVIQIDFGRQYPNKFTRKDALEDNLGRANPEIRSFLGRLSGQLVCRRLRDKTTSYSTELCKKDGFQQFTYPGAENDELYPPFYRHKHQTLNSCVICSKCQNQGDEVCEAALNSSCKELCCDKSQLLLRQRIQRAKGLEPDGSIFTDAAVVEDARKPLIHFGRIASGDGIMKSGKHRDEIAAREKVIAFEMEGAGAWDYLPTVVIKSVCDYADSHKNKAWQEYAAANAAACTKAFLEEWRSTVRLPEPRVPQNRSAAELLRQNGFDLEDICLDKVKALLWAAERGHDEVVQMLLENGANITAMDKDGNTALHKAAFNGHEVVVQLLLNKGSHINARNQEGGTALFGAAANGNEAVVQLLLNNGADATAKSRSGFTVLHIAAMTGHDAVVQLLIENGADFTTKGTHGMTALLFATKNGHEAVVRLLLEKGADVTSTGPHGMTALLFATKNGHEAMVRLLLEKGADATSTWMYGRMTALHLAAKRGHLAVMDVLLEKGADIDAQIADGETALHWAARNGRSEVVYLLLEKGADVAVRDKDGWTGLHHAADNGHFMVVAQLLEKGADAIAKDNDGCTALDLATKNGHDAVVPILEMAKSPGKLVTRNEPLKQIFTEHNGSSSIGAMSSSPKYGTELKRAPYKEKAAADRERFEGQKAVSKPGFPLQMPSFTLVTQLAGPTLPDRNGFEIEIYKGTLPEGWVAYKRISPQKQYSASMEKW
jgi:ankyrin repeat protein/nucleoside phosphorylase